MAKKTKKTVAASRCGCLKCAVRDTVHDYYHKRHGDSPGETVMDSEESVNALACLIAEIVSVLPERAERMAAVSHIAGGILTAAEYIRDHGQAPPSTEGPARNTALH